ncbi:MAG: tetratricopeptide repeat protein [Alphaproteobacteria bacterium]|nr:tetratricopeptide repeat protein [Alphaproteobacteria bacterium]
MRLQGLKKNASVLVMTVSACALLGACQTAKSVDANGNKTVHTASIDSAISRAAIYNTKPARSVTYLERAYKQSPTDEALAIEYASALRGTDELGKAELILAPFAKMDPPSSAAASEYAAIQLAKGEYEAAEKHAQNAILADDANFKAYHRLGIALDAQGQHEPAERAYRKGLDLWQGDPTTIMNNLALNLATQGFLDESAEILRKAQAVDPNRDEIERNLRIVTALQQAEGAPVPKPGKKPEAAPPPEVQTN